MLFGNFNKSVVIDGNKLNDTIRAFNELGINEYEFIELGLGNTGLWCVMFKAKKKTFYKFLTKVRVNYISCR